MRNTLASSEQPEDPIPEQKRHILTDFDGMFDSKPDDDEPDDEVIMEPVLDDLPEIEGGSPELTDDPELNND